MKTLLIVLSLCLMTACSVRYENQQVTGKVLPQMQAESLDKQQVILPDAFRNKATLLLIGYKQDSQFDIDRWLIGLDMKQVSVDVYEVPAIQGMFPRMFKTFINNGMRSGIPKELWKGVITLYQDGEAMQAFTGNNKPNNARVMLLNQKGEVVYFYDRGFSVAALNALISVIE